MAKIIKNQKVADAIRAVAENGIISPEKVVLAAKPKNSPLHEFFDWDDGDAAFQWRLHQARNLIRVVVEVEELPDRTFRDVRVFVSLSSDRNKDGGYRIMAEVLTDERRTKEMLEDALRELLSFRKKYEMLKELASIFKAIDKLPLIKKMKR